MLYEKWDASGSSNMKKITLDIKAGDESYYANIFRRMMVDKKINIFEYTSMLGSLKEDDTPLYSLEELERHLGVKSSASFDLEKIVMETYSKTGSEFQAVIKYRQLFNIELKEAIEAVDKIITELRNK